ncbi:MAG: hypothetical protein GXO75_01510 [Calditrichaeota bacterium]|nr:hypothetical protein [Calditrichota bacterium]
MIKKIPLFLLFFLISPSLSLADDEVCLDCHSDPTLTATIDGKTVHLYVNEKKYKNSIHGENGCVSCHEDVDEENLPHETLPKKVACQNCHDEEGESYNSSLHGKAVAKGDPDAPTCRDCHGYHNVLSPKNPASPTYIRNIPALCGSCHRENSKMVKRHKIPEKNIIQNYSMSIHGKGLFERGLIVTAVCTSCHTSHNILPPQDPKSSINRNNIAATCMKCHAQIEQVHLKVIRGELWEKKPHLIPACVDCHSPHKIRRVFYYDTMNDEFCMSCHNNRKLIRRRGDHIDSLFVDIKHFRNSVHGDKVQCIKCHVNVSHQKLPVCKDSGPVDCSICHADQVSQFQQSIHGQLLAKNNPNAPTCGDCHGTHFVQSKKDLSSPTFPRNIPQLCGKCHRQGEKAAVRYKGKEQKIIKNYSMSIHGKGLVESGLLVSAECTNCHTAHLILPASNPKSSVNPHNISQTCSQCHFGVYEQFKNSIHSPLRTKTKKKLPTCYDCHQAHTIQRIDKKSFRQQILGECGDCHKTESETYFTTYHGKVSKLGSGKTAKCSDCHGSHNILPPEDPKSTLSYKNIIQTCKKCHKSSNRKFTGYLTHATHHNRAKYPFLYYTFWAMTFLLIGTFSFFGVHTLSWIPRSFRERFKLGKELKRQSKSYYVRFDPVWSIIHVIVIISFFGLAITGMSLKFAGKSWAVFIANLLGGFEAAGTIHRICAVLTFSYFIGHFYVLSKKWKQSNKTLRQFIFDKEGLMPNWNDAKEYFQTFRWFFGRKKKPHYGRWTYWEKFDYFAVFWGVVIIGATGLILWFPEFFTHFVPGIVINIATIIHSDEALLAVGFIFTIHFFNTHLRPEKFPLDPVIFTGRVPLELFKHERPREYELAKKEGTFRKRLKKKPSKLLLLAARIFGFFFLLLGFALIGMIIWSMIFQYK